MQTFWNALAALGAITGVFALGWQVFTWKRSQPRLIVESREAWTTQGGHISDPLYAIRVTNHGGAATEVTSWGLTLPDDSTLALVQATDFSDKLGRIEPHGQLTFYTEAKGITDVCRKGNVAVSDLRPFVTSSTQGRIYGKPLPLKGE